MVTRGGETSTALQWQACGAARRHGGAGDGRRRSWRPRRRWRAGWAGWAGAGPRADATQCAGSASLPAARRAGRPGASSPWHISQGAPSPFACWCAVHGVHAVHRWRPRGGAPCPGHGGAAPPAPGGACVCLSGSSPLGVGSTAGISVTFGEFLLNGSQGYPQGGRNGCRAPTSYQLARPTPSGEDRACALSPHPGRQNGHWRSRAHGGAPPRLSQSMHSPQLPASVLHQPHNYDKFFS